MSARVRSDQALAVGEIALRIPMNPTSGDVLKALNEAWRAGHSSGFKDGSKHTASVLDAVAGALT